MRDREERKGAPNNGGEQKPRGGRRTNKDKGETTKETKRGLYKSTSGHFSTRLHVLYKNNLSIIKTLIIAAIL
jgi:hypothetical protein